MQEIVYVFGFNWSSTCGVCLKRLGVCCKYLQPACSLFVFVCVFVSSPVGSFNNWKLHTHTQTHTKSRVALYVLCHGTLVLGPFAAHCQGLPLESFDLLYCSVLCHCRIYFVVEFMAHSLGCLAATFITYPIILPPVKRRAAPSAPSALPDSSIILRLSSVRHLVNYT